MKLDQVKLVEPRALIAADVDGDGAADLIVTQPDETRCSCTIKAAIKITHC